MVGNLDGFRNMARRFTLFLVCGMNWMIGQGTLVEVACLVYDNMRYVYLKKMN
jgi:hypothetical protein